MRLLLAVLPLLPGFAWLLWWYRQDRYEPEPKRWVIGAFLLGAATVWPAGHAASALDGLLHLPSVERMLLRHDVAGLVVALVLVTGPIEETCKWLVVRLLCYPSREFDEPFDGIVYGTAAALGFASLENVAYLHSLHGPRDYAVGFVLRAVSSVPMHAMCGAVLGYGLGNAKVGRGSSLPWLALAALAHGLFDLATTVSLFAGVVALLPMAILVQLLVQAHRARSPFRPGEGVALRRLLLADESHTGSSPPGLAVRCATCSAIWRASDLRCERCGGRLDGAPHLCGRCGADVDAEAGDRECLHCGGRLR